MKKNRNQTVYIEKISKETIEINCSIPQESLQTMHSYKIQPEHTTVSVSVWKADFFYLSNGFNVLHACNVLHKKATWNSSLVLIN